MSNLNFKINKQDFYNALQISSRAISSNSPVPALTGIKIEASSDGLKLTSSDADIAIEQILSNDKKDVGLSVISEGSIVIDSRYLLEIVKNIDSEEINVEIIDGTLTRFSGGKAEYKINGFNANDYPTIDFSKPNTILKMSYSDFASLINQTVFATSNKETRPVLTGVNLNNDGKKLTCTATDSYRLARKIISVDVEPFNITIPARSLNEAKSIFQNEEEIEIAISQKKVDFISDTVILQTRLLEGVYPETDRLIPTEFNSKMLINRDSFIKAVGRTTFIKTDNMPIIRLQMNSKDDIAVSSKSQEIGEFHEDLVGNEYEGNPLDISFAANYLIDAARAIQSENIWVKFTSEMKPFILTNESDEEDLIQLVLPVRTYN